MNQNILIVIFLSFILASCFEKFDVNIDPNEQRVAIEAMLSPAHQCLVRLTRTGGYTHNYNLENPNENIKTIPDALVILSDDTGQTDTAIMLICPEMNDTATWNKYRQLLPHIYYNWENNSMDTLHFPGFLYPLGNFSGYYTTTKFRAIAGRSYHLYVQSEGKEYSADAYMPDVPEIDSGSIINKISPIDGDGYAVPRVSFHEPPDQENYYMLSFHQDLVWQTDDRKTPDNINITILSDEFLPEYVFNLSVFSESDRNNAFGLNTLGCLVFMYSLDKPAYQYLKCLLEQIRSDGGIYSAAPANLPTNFTGGALGFFIATDESFFLIKNE